MKQIIANLKQDLYTKLINYDIYSVCEGIALAYNREIEAWFIIEFIRSGYEFHEIESKDTANLIYQDYLNQIVYEENAKLNLELGK